MEINWVVQIAKKQRVLEQRNPIRVKFQAGVLFKELVREDQKYQLECLVGEIYRLMGTPSDGFRGLVVAGFGERKGC